MSEEDKLFAYVMTPEKIEKKARKAERERIIALLSDEAEIWHSENFQIDLIALINGEN